MRRSPRRHGASGGFTLAELLVVVVILAGLATVAAVSVETTQNKARSDKTALIGRQVTEGFQSTDDLSFISDFGRLPKTEEEVMFLFSQRIVDASGGPQEADGYDFLALDLNLPASLPAGAPGSSQTKLEDLFGAPRLGVGWRGPYTTAGGFRYEEDEPSEFLDGWNNDWRALDEDELRLNGTVPFASSKTLAMLRSVGRDGETGGVDWQDQDSEFRLLLDVGDVDLVGQIRIRGADGTEYTSAGQFTSFTLRVTYFAPDCDDEYFVTNDTKRLEFTWSSGSWTNPGGTEVASDNPFQFLLEGLTAGHRVVFVYGFGTPLTPTGATQALYGGGARLLRLQPGTNRTEIWLTER